jgi:hypothetical protein
VVSTRFYLTLFLLELECWILEQVAKAIDELKVARCYGIVITNGLVSMDIALPKGVLIFVLLLYKKLTFFSKFPFLTLVCQNPQIFYTRESKLTIFDTRSMKNHKFLCVTFDNLLLKKH